MAVLVALVVVTENGDGSGGDGNNINLDNYYTKSEVDALIDGIEVPETDLSDYYTKTEVDGLIDNIDIPETDLSNYYTKPEIDAQFDALDTTGVSTSGTKFDEELNLANQQDVNYYLDGKVGDVEGSVGDITEEINNITEEITNINENITNINNEITIDGGGISSHVDKLDEKLEFEIANRVLGDNDLQDQINAINETGYDDTELRGLIQTEEDERKAADNELAVELLKEKRERQDADYNLLARINGIQIPEMPGDYDDSGLRELIENESALRATGDAYLQQEIDNIEQYDDSNVRELIEQEKALRVSGDALLQEQINNLDLSDFDLETLFIGEKPPEEGDYVLWFDSDRLELYVKYEETWLPASPSIGGGGSEDGSKAELQDLESVLKQGAVADKGILLTDGADTLIELNPEAKMVGVASHGNPKLRLVHMHDDQTDAHAQIEIDNDGTRVDFEFTEKITDVHFRFDDQEKLILNRDGDAEFVGRVIAEPGRTGNELATIGQLVTLQEEIEQLRPSLGRGMWEYKKVWNGDQGTYALSAGELSVEELKERCDTALLQCQADAAGDPIANSDCTREWGECNTQAEANGGGHDFVEEWVDTNSLLLSWIDLNGHQYTPIPDNLVDKYIQFFNNEDEGFALFKINTAKWRSNDLDYELTVDLIQSKGKPKGAASVQLFDVDDDVDAEDLLNFVKKSGDEMTGGLKITGRTSDADPLLKLVPTESSTETSDIIRVHNTEDKVKFYVTEAGGIGTGDGYEPSRSNYLTNKAYVDATIAEKIAEALANQPPADVPVGTIVFWGGSEGKIPSGWVKCEGQRANDATKLLTGVTYIPDLKDYMPAHTGGKFGNSRGSMIASRVASHSHKVTIKEPGDTTGYPNGNKDSSSSSTRYWRGNKGGNGSSGISASKLTTTYGDSITAPPVYLGFYIMKVA